MSVETLSLLLNRIPYLISVRHKSAIGKDTLFKFTNNYLWNEN